MIVCMFNSKRASTKVKGDHSGSRITLCPITALCSLGDFVLAGEGARLLVYNRDSRDLKQNLNLFQSQTVHALFVSQNCLLHESQRILLACAGSLIHCLVLRSSDGFR